MLDKINIFKKWYSKSIELYLEHCQSKNLSDGTVASYYRQLILLFGWLDKNFNDIKELSDIRQPHIARYMIALQANSNDATIKSIFTILKIFFTWADGYESFESDGKGGFITLIEKNPMSKMVAPRAVKKETIFLDEIVVEKLLESCKKSKRQDYFYALRRRVMIYLLITTGLRKNEITNIKVSNINIKTNDILVLGKGRKERRVPILEGIKDDLVKYLNIRNEKLKRYKKHHDSLWVSKKGVSNASIEFIQMEIRELQSLSGIKFPRAVHIFRNTFAAWSLIKGMDLYEVMYIGGWSDLKMLLHYTQMLKHYRKNNTATFALNKGPKGFYPSQTKGDK